MNDVYREFKARLRRLDEILAARGLTGLEFPQALSLVHRAERRGDRSREPSEEPRVLLERAEALARRSA